MEIRETQIEDILVVAPYLTKKILDLEDEPKLIGRQMILPSGRLDMLYAYKTEFLLLELKISAFQKKFIQQVLDYKSDLIAFQKKGKLLQGEIIPYLILPKIKVSDIKIAENEGLKCLEYNPEEILKYFYNEKLRPITSFVEIKPIDIGIWNIHLINKFIYDLKQTNSIKELRQSFEGSQKTLYNKIKFASELNLINWTPNGDYIALSEFGKKYVNSNEISSQVRLNEEQANLLKNYVMQNPYASSVVLGIASLVESIFSLSKNTYPVPISQLIEYFTYHAEKIYDWQTDKAKFHGAKMYSNYAIELGLVAKTDNHIYLTPEGFKFVIQMQLHKSLKLMDNLVVT
jgi:hypothetical protein